MYDNYNIIYIIFIIYYIGNIINNPYIFKAKRVRNNQWNLDMKIVRINGK